jgi:hypothetical protein
MHAGTKATSALSSDSFIVAHIHALRYHQSILSWWMPMKPTPEQIERIKVWLDARLSALFAGRSFPPLPFSIECDQHNGVDFLGIFGEYGFAVDGLQLLPNFYEISRLRVYGQISPVSLNNITTLSRISRTSTLPGTRPYRVAARSTSCSAST